MRVLKVAVLFVLFVPAAATAQRFGGYVTTDSGPIDYPVTRETIFQASGGVACA